MLTDLLDAASYCDGHTSAIWYYFSGLLRFVCYPLLIYRRSNKTAQGGQS